MNKKLLNTISLIYLLCFMHFSTNINSISITKNSITKNLKNKSEDAGTAVEAGKMAGTCMKALMESVPPEFCWKRGADAGIIPTGCPAGYFRSLALCFQHCNPGYRHVLGICWADCPRTHADHGLTCFRHIFSWYFKHSYIPHSITNFSDRVPCPRGMYRLGALCYRDCKNIGMENCGIGACSIDSASCGSSIANMVIDVLQGIADAVMTIVTLGNSAPAKSALSTGIKKAGKDALKKGMNSLKKVFNSQFRGIILEKARRAMKDKAKEIVTGKLTEVAVTNICKGIWNTAIDRTKNQNDINVDTLVNAVDVFNVKGIVTNCADTSTEKGAIDCASNVLSGLSTFDPTGLLTIANAFMKPSCDVTTEVIDPMKDMPADIGKQEVIPPTKEQQEVQQAVNQLQGIKDNCIYLYDNCGFQGPVEEVCGDKTFLGRNDLASSLKAGKNASGLLFEHGFYHGRSIPFGPDTLINCLEDFKNVEYKLNDLVSSVKFGADKCLIINYRRITERNSDLSWNQIFCTSTPKLDLELPRNLDYIHFRSHVQNFSATLYEGENYTGLSMEIKGNLFPAVEEFKLFNIRSYKINLA